jgi:two-component system, LuxR family, sensor kinase FixL
MSYVTIVWSVIAASALVLGVMHTLVWILDRRAYANLAFAVAAFAATGIAWVELGMMSAATAPEWGSWVRWYQVPNFCLIVGTLAFVRLYLGTGRLWLMWAVIALRVAILVINFAVEPNFNFEHIGSIVRIPFLGEDVSVLGHAITAPRQWIATLATILSVLFVADASITLLRRRTAEGRRKALMIGGAIAFTFTAAILNTQLVIWGVVDHAPTLTAPPFLITLAAMAFEMSRDTLRASRLARELRDSQHALELAASAAGLGLWSCDPKTGRLWATERARAMFALERDARIELERLIAMIPDQDMNGIRESLQAAAASGTEQEVRFRVSPVGIPTRWLLARGRYEPDTPSAPALIRGVVRDVTEEHRTQQELEELRRDLAHAGRVTALGQLSSAIAHELRQPLTAILSNVQAAQMILKKSNPDLQELREILVDIDRDDLRAGEVIDRLRAMLKRRPMELQPVNLDDLLQDVILLIRSDADARGVLLETSIENGSLVAGGDRVQLCQVLINLIMNAMDACAGVPAARRRVLIQARAMNETGVEITVADFGTGIPPEQTEQIFAPFFTTKPSGMGMGLCVSRTIIRAHGGRLWVENNAMGGATFHLAISAFQRSASRVEPTERLRTR